MKRVGWAIAIIALVLALAHAISRIWLSDDAFITFRYADHLAHGHGLVFNVGERVEGDTNFLWTLWIAVGRLLGASATGWSIVWGIACYVAALALIARRSLQLDAITSAVLFAAAHVAWAEFATSGLETRAFALLAFGGYVLVCPESDAAPSRRRIAAAGVVLALDALTRPDGILFGAVAGVWLLAQQRVRDHHTGGRDSPSRRCGIALRAHEQIAAESAQRERARLEAARRELGACDMRCREQHRARNVVELQAAPRDQCDRRDVAGDAPHDRPPGRARGQQAADRAP